jgi:hypothetical protein
MHLTFNRAKFSPCHALCYLFDRPKIYYAVYKKYSNMSIIYLLYYIFFFSDIQDPLLYKFNLCNFVVTKKALKSITSFN